MKLKKELFSAPAYWIIDNDPNYTSFGECKSWIKKQNSLYKTSTNDEKEILILLTFLPISPQMNNSLYAKYLDQKLTK